MSQSLSEAFERDGQTLGQTATKPQPKSFSRQLAIEFPAVIDRIRVLFRILGAENGSWNGLDWADQIADEQLRRYPQRQLAAGCESALLADDRQVRRGAARFWESWRSPLAAWKPPRLAQLRSAVLTVLQESRDPGRRQDAMESLREWWSEMPAAEREQRLRAGLRDPHDAVRRRAMLVAGQVGEGSAEDPLLRVLRGEAVEPIALPLVPASEEEDVGSYADPVAPDSAESDVAALALGYLRSRLAQAPIEERAAASGSALLRVARALSDERCDLLVADDFRTNDHNQALQLAAVEAVVRCRGRTGLDLALRYNPATHGWEGEYVAGRLRRMLLAQNAAGADLLRTVKTLPQLRAWYQRYGQAYLKRAQAR
jgi:hypothetical protein